MNKWNLKVNTIRTFLSSIAFTHKMKNFSNPAASFKVAKCLKGASKASLSKIKVGSNCTRKRLPITKQILENLIDSIDHLELDSYDHILYKALFLLTFYACLRAGEVVNSNNRSNIITFQQVKYLDKGNKSEFEITFERYKHSKEPLTLLLKSANQPEYCPVKALKNYLSIRGKSDGPIFFDKTKKTISRNRFAKILKQTLKIAGYNEKHFNTHSFRIGRTTDLALKNVPLSLIKAIGRWKSNAFMKYIKIDHTVLPP